MSAFLNTGRSVHRISGELTGSKRPQADTWKLKVTKFNRGKSQQFIYLRRWFAGNGQLIPANVSNLGTLRTFDVDVNFVEVTWLGHKGNISRIGMRHPRFAGKARFRFNTTGREGHLAGCKY